MEEDNTKDPEVWVIIVVSFPFLLHDIPRLGEKWGAAKSTIVSIIFVIDWTQIYFLLCCFLFPMYFDNFTALFFHKPVREEFLSSSVDG
jgi:hypothetical protein